MSQKIRVCAIAVAAAVLAGGGVAFAQGNGPEPGGTAPGGGGLGTGGGGATAATPAPGAAATPSHGQTAGPASAAYPMAAVARSLQLPRGVFEVGGTVAIPDGPDNAGTFGLGNWLGFELSADYGITNRIQVGLRLPLLPVKPTDPLLGGRQESTAGGIAAEGLFGINDAVSIHAVLGYVRQVDIPLNEAVYPLENLTELKLGLRLGVSFKTRLLQDKLAVMADPAFEMQDDSAQNTNSAGTFFGLRVPVVVLYQIVPAVAAGIRTGIYTGKDFDLDAKDSATIPVLAEGMYTSPGGSFDVGADFGFASLLTTSNRSFVAPYDTIPHSLYIGVFGAWRTSAAE